MPFTEFYWVLLEFTGFYQVIQFYLVLLGFIRFNWVLPSFHWVLLGFIGFY